MKRFPLRGGNWNNGTNAGLGALNVNNDRGNSNSNIGFRPALENASSTSLKGLCACTFEKDAVSSANAEIVNGHAGAPAECLYEKIYQFENLYRAAHACRKGKSKKLPTIRFFNNLEENLVQLHNEFVWGEYAPGTYTQFYVSEPKRRLIRAPQFIDRVAQRAIYNHIEPIFDRQYIHDSYACRLGKGTHAGADRAQLFIQQVEREHGKVYALKCDVSKYFSSIDHNILKQLLARRIHCPRTLALLYLIVDESPSDSVGCGIPLGNLLSQVFANVYLHELDFFVKHTLKVKRYVRYMDDFVILHHDKAQLHQWREQIEEFLHFNLRLSLNSRTQVFPIQKKRGRALDFLGYRIYSTHRLLRKNSVKRIKANMKKCRRQYARGEINLSDIQPKIQSWLGHAGHANTYNLRKALLKEPLRRNHEEL